MKATKERRVSDVDTFASELLAAPTLTEEHLALQHSQRLKLFSLMVLTIEPNTELSSIGVDVDLSSKAIPMLVEKPSTTPKAKSSPTLINVILKSTAKDLISIFLQTADSDHDSDEYLLRISSTQFYLKNHQIPLHRWAHVLCLFVDNTVMFVGTSISGIVYGGGKHRDLCWSIYPVCTPVSVTRYTKILISCRMKSSLGMHLRIFYEVTVLSCCTIKSYRSQWCIELSLRIWS